jgi:transposase-like protein
LVERQIEEGSTGLMLYRRRRFDAEIIEPCVRWYITYRLGYRSTHNEECAVFLQTAPSNLYQ